HDLAYLERVGFGERAAKDGEVLRENIDKPAVDFSVAGDEAVAGRTLIFHAEVDAAMADKFVELFEGAFVEQQIDALACSQLAGLVLALAALRATASFGFGGTAAQFFKRIVARDLLFRGEPFVGGVVRQAGLPWRNPLEQKF